MKFTKDISTELQNIATRKYVLDETALAHFATTALDANESAVGLRQAYLRVLLAGAQLALGESSPTVHGTRSHDTLDDASRKAQHQALAATHERYYTIILAAVTAPEIADSPRLGNTERHRRALERNRRTNYARTAKSALKALVDVGYSLLEISVMTATKGLIAQLVGQRRPATSPTKGTIPNKLQALTHRIVEGARLLAESDLGQAAEVIQRAMTQLGAIGLELGAKPARSLDVGFREHRPVRLKEGLFWPIEPSAVQMRTTGVELRTTQ